MRHLPRCHRRLFPAFVFLVLACAALSAQVSSSWVALGPEGGDARSLAYDPHDSNRIFLGTSAGEIYLSSDGGHSWSRFAHLGDANDYVFDNIVIDPGSPATIYAAAWSVENGGGDLFRSRDSGKTWTALPGMRGKSIRAFSLAPSDSRVLIVGALDGVFRSDDGGDTWRQISPARHAEIKNIESIAVDPRTPDIVYAGTWHLAWKTVDGGQHWHSIKNGVIDDSDVFSIIIDPTRPNVVYASACSGIYKSENSGELFRKVQGIPFSARRTRVLQQDPSNPLIVYAGTTEGLWKTTDGGQTWSHTTAPNLIVNDVLIDPRQPSHVLLATDRSGVLASTDGVQTVAASNRGFSHRQVSAVLADRADPAVMYAGVVNDKEFGGIFMSRDAGVHWSQANSGLAEHDIFTLAQAPDGDLVAGTNRGIYLFDRKLTRWQSINSVAVEKTLLVRRGQGKHLKPEIRRQITKSRLDGRVWQIRLTSERWFAATSAGLFTSVDRGRTWRGGSVAGNQNFVSVDALNDKVIAVTPAVVLISSDGGASFSSSTLPPFVTRVFGVALTPDALWISTREGAFYSRDKGATWNHVVVGLPARNLISLRYDTAAHRLLGVTTSGEVFSTRDGEAWDRIADPGWMLRAVSVAAGRLLGITAFSGIVAQPASEPSRAMLPSGSE